MAFTHAFQTPGLYIGSGYEVVGEVDDYPAGSAGYWLRKRLDTRGDPTTITRVRYATLALGIAVVLALEAIDAIRVVRRRAAHLAAEWLASVERRERREARRAEIVAFAVPVMRALTDPAPGSGRPPVRTTRPRP